MIRSQSGLQSAAIGLRSQAQGSSHSRCNFSIHRARRRTAHMHPAPSEGGTRSLYAYRTASFQDRTRLGACRRCTFSAAGANFRAVLEI